MIASRQGNRVAFRVAGCDAPPVSRAKPWFFESYIAHYTIVHYLTILGENHGFLGDCVVSAPNVRRAAIPCGYLLRRFLRLNCAGICAALKAPGDRVSKVVIPAHEVVP